MVLVLFKRSFVNEVRSFCLQKHNLLRDLRSTISQTYNVWIVCQGFDVHRILYAKSLKGLFRRKTKNCTELEPRISMEREKNGQWLPNRIVLGIFGPLRPDLNFKSTKRADIFGMNL
ncbi:hypothetical protein BFP75_07225 [Maribacter sp. 4G9]|nr:hypothetical protein BFP75_07225 [Maribacter sp. 4G9]